MHKKRNNEQSEKTCYSMDKVVVNSIWHKDFVAKIYKELIQLNNKQSELNVNKRIEIFFQRNTNDQHNYKKMSSIKNPQGLPNQNQKETSPDTFQCAYYHKT